MRTDILKQLIQAGNPIISMETPDEPRAAAMVRDAARQLGCRCPNGPSPKASSPSPPPRPNRWSSPARSSAALRYIKESTYPADLSLQGSRPPLQGSASRPRASAISISRPARGSGPSFSSTPPPLPPEVRRLDRPLRRRLARRRGTRGNRSHHLSGGATPQPRTRSNRN